MWIRKECWDSTNTMTAATLHFLQVKNYMSALLMQRFFLCISVPAAVFLTFHFVGEIKDRGSLWVLRSHETEVRLKAIYSALCIFLGLYFQIEHKVSATHIAFRKMNLTKIYTMHSFSKHLFLTASYISGSLLAQGTQKWMRESICLQGTVVDFMVLAHIPSAQQLRKLVVDSF